jgi:hypothetical protein
MVRLPHEQLHRHTADFVRHLAGLALDRRTTSCGRGGVDQAARRSRGLDSPKRAAISADSRAAARVDHDCLLIAVAITARGLSSHKIRCGVHSAN